MPTNKRKRENLQTSANAVGQTNLSVKKQKSSLSEMADISFKLFISKLKQFSLANLLHIF